MTDQQEQWILSYLQDKLPPEERKAFDVWQNESEENRNMVAHFKAIWKLTELNRKAIDFQGDDEWKKLSSSVYSSQPPIMERSSPFSQPWMRIAASVIFILLCGGAAYYTFFRDRQVVVEAQDTERQLRLNDGSVVLLSEGSRLLYNEKTFSKSRELTLYGEAFFNVTPNPQNPFTIKTARAQVKVLGTAFNVRAYKNEPSTTVSVLNGVVAFVGNDLSNEIVLARGDVGILDQHGQLAVSANDDETVIWEHKKLQFKKAPLSKLLMVLRSYFNMQIELKNSKLENCRFTGSFANPTFEEVVETLQLALELEVKVENNKYFVDGAGCE
jgi:transmembrane sensor